MNSQDEIKELFAQKLRDHQLPVSPEVWASVSSQIGTAAVATTTVISTTAKIIAGLVGVGCVIVGTYLLLPTTNSDNTQQILPKVTERSTPIIEQQSEVVDSASFNSASTQNKTSSPVFSSHEQSVSNDRTTNTDSIAVSITSTNNHIDKTSDHLIAITSLHNETHPQKEVATSIEKELIDVASKQPESDVLATSREPESISFEIIRLPNIYLPRSSGYFSIEYQGSYRDFQLTILNSNNKVVFSTNDPDIPWHGTDLGGQLVPSGNYFYILTVTDSNGERINKYSTLRIEN